ncbi:GH11799 [Drosophila grimshawi]|uniref:GH11799 n=2 Tax=Drosophila grimshawi TaxID=7222 RepID=B4JJ09_DROGR|nr:GH11799 [Drosophila grimshawi]
MSLLDFGGEDGSSGSDTEPDAHIDFTAMLMERNQECNGGHSGDDCKLQSQTQSQDEHSYYLAQYVLGVHDFSSQYGIDYSISYTAANVIGRPSKYPTYGDYPEAFCMRTFGDWWHCAPSSTREIQPQNLPALPTHDFIVVYFEEFVIPKEVSIFETYNPGGVVRIWAYSITKRWTCLWEASSSDLNKFKGNFTREARRFAPTLKNTNILTKTLRIDFNHSRLNYYTQIDAILLYGRTGSTRSMQQMLTPMVKRYKEDINSGPILCKLRTLKFQPSCRENCTVKLHEFINNDLSQFLKENQKVSEEQQLQSSGPQSSLTDLPFEILLKILSYLDLKSLFCVGQVSRLFYEISTHPLLYCDLSLKPYWQLANSELLCTLARRATLLRKLDLSWCGGFGEVSPTEFKKFLTQRGDNLTHLRLNSCKFLNASCIETIGIVCDNLIELSLRNCGSDTPLLNFSCLANLKNLERLDLFQTAFESELLLSMLEGNRKLKHLNLAFCGVSVNMDNVAAHLATYNTQLVSLDMWKAHFLSARGLQSLARCHQLEELDLGWCMREANLGDGLYQLLTNCPKLKKLFLSAMRGITERDLTHIATLGKNLEQLDLMGVTHITHERAYDILVRCKKLKLLDLSFCDNIMDREHFNLIIDWSRLFKVKIQFSRNNYDR